LHLVADAEVISRDEWLRELRRLCGCTVREAQSTAELLDVLHATLRRRLPLTLEVVDFQIEFARRER
jgi:hypothetical protein